MPGPLVIVVARSAVWWCGDITRAAPGEAVVVGPDQQVEANVGLLKTRCDRRAMHLLDALGSRSCELEKARPKPARERFQEITSL
ncbi:MAG: hypothetical protein JWL59_1961 [Chthoniobacteraceae bacterium]|nr:hypothetical protein [Chthoniobacteraceae bacterium]